MREYKCSFCGAVGWESPKTDIYGDEIYPYRPGGLCSDCQAIYEDDVKNNNFPREIIVAGCKPTAGEWRKLKELELLLENTEYNDQFLVQVDLIRWSKDCLERHQQECERRQQELERERQRRLELEVKKLAERQQRETAAALREAARKHRY